MSPSVKILFTALCASLVACGAEESSVETAQAVVEDAAESTAESLDVLTPELGTFGIDLSHQDPNTRPGDDFFRYTNGNWLDSYELPADRSNYGSFSVLGDRSDERVRTIITDLTSIEPAQDSMEQKISDYYLSYMDTDALNEIGISPLLPGLSRLAEVDTQEELVAAFGRARIDTTASPISFGISPISRTARPRLTAFWL